MAKLIMKDGTVRNCEYNKAAKIQQVMVGIEKPESEEQAEFVKLVKRVDFGNDTEIVHGAMPSPKPETKRPDQIAKIMSNPKLNGYQRAKAVAKAIRGRK